MTQNTFRLCLYIDLGKRIAGKKDGPSTKSKMATAVHFERNETSEMKIIF